MDEQKTTETEKAAGSAVEKIAETLKINLSKERVPLPIKLIALLTLAGGLSIAGSALTDIINPQKVSFGLQLLRISSGFLFILIAYGLVKRRRWAIWAYGALVIVGLFINPALSIIPAAIAVYLYFERQFFEPSVFDYAIESLASFIKNWMIKT